MAGKVRRERARPVAVTGGARRGRALGGGKVKPWLPVIKGASLYLIMCGLYQHGMLLDMLYKRIAVVE